MFIRNELNHTLILRQRPTPLILSEGEVQEISSEEASCVEVVQSVRSKWVTLSESILSPRSATSVDPIFKKQDRKPVRTETLGETTRRLDEEARAESGIKTEVLGVPEAEVNTPVTEVAKDSATTTNKQYGRRSTN